MNPASIKNIVLRLLVPAVIAVVFFYIYQHPLIPSSNIFPQDTSTASTTTETTTSSSIAVIADPKFLIIPSINLRVNIQHVGKTWSGSMAVPTNFTDAGWYELGAAPGSNGNAVIDGHVDNALGLNAVFKNLTKLVPGDLLYVENASGTKTTFKMIRAEVYPYNHAPIKKIFGATSTKALNLITCSGTWLSADRTESNRLVVYTEAVS